MMQMPKLGANGRNAKSEINTESHDLDLPRQTMCFVDFAGRVPYVELA